MATIRKRKRKDGTVSYEVQVRRKGFPNLTATFDKKALADRWGNDKENEIQNGLFKDTREASETLLADLFDKYLLSVTPTKEASSYVPEKARLGTLKRFFGTQTLTRLGVKGILEYVDCRLEKVSSDAIRRELQLLSDVVDSAQSLWGLHIVANPVPNAKRILRKLRKLKAGNRRDRRLFPGEYEKIRSAKHARFTVINRLALFDIETGLRRGELADSRREYADLTKRVIHVPDSKTDWKTGNKGRIVPLSPIAIDIINSLPEFPDGSLFGLRAESISQAFERLCEDQGIVDLRFHDLRHEAISRWFEMGFLTHEVAAMSGHSDWRSLKRYTHPDPEKLAQKMAEGSQGNVLRLDSRRNAGSA